MAKFICIRKEGDRFLNLEHISYIDTSTKTVWTIEPHREGQCKYSFDDREHEDVWSEILNFLYNNEYKKDHNL